MSNSPNLTNLILRNLIQRESYCRKSIPHIKPEYFEGSDRIVYDLILRFIIKYSKLPNTSAIQVEYEQSDFKKLNADEVTSIIHSLSKTDEDTKEEWLLDATEKWCKDRAVYLAIMESIQIIDGKTKDGKSEGAIPEILSKALAVTFDTAVGHDYIENASDRYDAYHRVEEKISFDLEMFNTITKGGVPKKTLNIILAGTGVGKSLMMCHFAGAALQQGKNVLYITMEMAEERIAERIDANLFDITMDDLERVPKATFESKINEIRKKTSGRLVVKEYPTGSAHAGHFRALLSELQMKKTFTPDIIFIDYLNICASSRISGLGGSINTYSYVKSIAEEVRGLAVEAGLPIWSATQLNREGFKSSDVELEHTSESFGLPATADLMLAAISNDALASKGHLMIKQLKNRYNDPQRNQKFCIGVDKAHMRLFDLENPSAGIVQSSVQGNNPPTQTPFSSGGGPDYSGLKV
jgi:replicative DNA helicase